MSIENSQFYSHKPSRFEPKYIDLFLVYCHRFGASNITIQTDRPIVVEVYGRIQTVTRRELSNAESGDLLNTIYGPNGTTQIMRGEDIYTHYEIRPNRNESFRYRVNGTGCHIDEHEGIQIIIRTITAKSPSLSKLNLPSAVTPLLRKRKSFM